MSALAAKTSVIVPVGPNESDWLSFFSNIGNLDQFLEVIFVGCRALTESEAAKLQFHSNAKWIVSERAHRGFQLNLGIRESVGENIWILHIDSRTSPGYLSALEEALQTDRDEIHYFGLRFYDGGNGMRVNEVGVELRCNLFGLPFGDQGFYMKRSVFDKVGPFDEKCAFGEDHALVWRAKKMQVPVRRVFSSLNTSSRKYEKNGWLNTTGKHLYLTAKQAYEEWKKPL